MELGKECGEGATAMTEGELGLEVDLGHGAVELGEIEKRIVSETAGAAGSVEDHAFDAAVGLVCGVAVARGDKYATVACGAPRGRYSFETLQQDDVVPDVGVVVGIGGVDHAGVCGETGRAHAGSAGEGVNFETGVVGENELAGEELGVIDGFEAGVLGEGFAVFLWWFDAIEIRERNNGNRVGLGGGAEVA
jgi:hypothetical protein